MDSKKSSLIKIAIVIILIMIVIIDSFVIGHLQKKLDQITIVSYDADSLITYSPKSYKEPVILVTSDFIEKFSRYKSPFNDGLSFKELIKKYLHNAWSDHYGSPRGYKECRRIHEGIDLFVPENTPVFPLSDYGIVTEASDNPHYLVDTECTKPDGTIDTVQVEYGKTVRILYPEGIESIYTHLNEVFVSTGMEVNGNTKIGLTGRTGNIRNSGKASHLHLELRGPDNRTFDPRHRLHFEQGSIKNFIKHLKVE